MRGFCHECDGLGLATAGFAMMETLIVLAHALTRVRFETLPAVGFPGADAKITLRPQSVQLMVERR